MSSEVVRQFAQSIRDAAKTESKAVLKESEIKGSELGKALKGAGVYRARLSSLEADAFTKALAIGLGTKPELLGRLLKEASIDQFTNLVSYWDDFFSDIEGKK